MTEAAQRPSPFSVDVPPDVLRGGRRAGADVLAELRATLPLARVVQVQVGSRHAVYPPPPGTPVLAEITDPAVIARLVATLTDVGVGGLGPGALSDVVLDFTDEGEEWFRLITVTGGWVADNRTATGWPVDANAVAQALAAAGVPDDHLPWNRHPDHRPVTVPAARGRELTRRWLDRLPGSRPVSHELRTALADRWVRFHSLPGGRRYPDGEADRREIVRRHRAILAELGAWSGGEDLLLITATWSGDLVVQERPPYLAALTPRSWFWDSIAVDADDGVLGCVHLWVETVDRADQRLDLILRMVADEAISGVVLADPDLRWLYAPYDGGADVIAPDGTHRDRLAERYASWLPTNGSL